MKRRREADSMAMRKRRARQDVIFVSDESPRSGGHHFSKRLNPLLDDFGFRRWVAKRPYRFVPLVSPAYWQLRRWVNAWRYSGNAVWCPVCERSFKSWLGKNDSDLCPYCHSYCRHRLLSLHLAT